MARPPIRLVNDVCILVGVAPVGDYIRSSVVRRRSSEKTRIQVSLLRSVLWYDTYGTLRNNSQMPDDSRDDPYEKRKEAWPEVPAAPLVPETPVLKPKLPPRPKRTDRETEDQADARNMGLAYVLPMALAAPIVLLTLAGWWLDDHFHKSPYFTLGGALLGTVSGFINMIRIAGKLNR